MTTIASSPGNIERAAPAAAFGRYKLEERIGAGGMGVVYRAYDPMLERPVALKIVRSHNGDEEGQRRLFREAQVLAQVRHPNVVTVHDVGALGEDVFVAMELVEGTPLSKWQKERDAGEILGAYLQAGRGLAAAHERGLVHRDVKPGNILVGDDGRVTVIDFGLAAAVVDNDDAPVSGQHESVPIADGSTDDGSHSHSPLHTPLTEVGRVMGTPRYMSPEQHTAGQRVDALSDQFSFALALYEAMAGAWPFVKDESARDKADALRMAKVRGVFAPPARSISTHMRTTLQRALAVDPSERFPSMATLLDQLARDPARARRRQLSAAAVVFVAVLGSWSAIAERKGEMAAPCRGAAEELAKTWNPARREAVKNAFLTSGVGYASNTFERVASVLDNYGKRWTDMRTEACQATHVHGVQSDTVLDLRMGCLDRKRRSLQALVTVFADKPDRQVVDKAIEASLALGGLAMCADVKALEQEVEPPERPEDRRTLAELRGRLEKVNQFDTLGKYREAKALLDDLGPAVEALGFQPLQAELAYYTALTQRYLGRYAEAEPTLQWAIQLALKWGMKDLVADAEAEASYLVGYFLGRHAEGMLYALHAQGLTDGRGDELEARALQTLATLYKAKGEYGKAEDFDKRALAIREQAFGPDHLSLAKSLNNLAVTYEYQAKYAEAEKLQKRALAIWQNTLGPDHRYVAYSLNNLAVVYHAQGKDAEAEDLHKRALAMREKALGSSHHDVAGSLVNLADIYLEQGKLDKAEEFYQRALSIWEKALGPDHPHVAYPLVGLAETCEKRGHFTDALPLLERARKIRDSVNAAAKERAYAGFALARVVWEIGEDRARARSLAQEALVLFQAAGPGDDKKRSELEQWIAEHP